MLRRILLSSAGALALTGAAFAADLPSRAPPPVYVPPPPLFSWTGFYAGLNAGYHWGGSSYSFIGTDTDGAGLGTALGAGAILSPAAHGSNGFIGGGQIGYNYQIQSFVLGLEVDIDGATGRNSRTTFHDGDLGFVPIASNSAQQLDWLLRAVRGNRHEAEVPIVKGGSAVAPGGAVDINFETQNEALDLIIIANLAAANEAIGAVSRGRKDRPGTKRLS